MSGNKDIFEEAYEKVRINIETIERIKRENTSFMGIKNYENRKEFINEMKTLVYNTYVIMKAISTQHFKQNPNVFDQDSIIQSNVHVQNPIHDTIYTLFKMFPDNFNEIIQSIIIDLYRKRKPIMDFYNNMLVYLIFFLESFEQLEQKIFYMEFVCNMLNSVALFSPNVKFRMYHLYATKHNIIKKELEQTGYNTTKLDCMIPFNNTLDSTSISEEEAVRLGATPEPKDNRTNDQKRKALEGQNERNKRYRESRPSRKIPDSYHEMRVHNRNRVNDEIMALLGDLPELGADFFNMQPRGGKPKQRRKTRRTKKKSKKTKKRTTKYK